MEVRPIVISISEPLSTNPEISQVSKNKMLKQSIHETIIISGGSSSAYTKNFKELHIKTMCIVSRTTELIGDVN